MGKKYLDTKQSTIEAAVLDVWVDAAEEQKAIRSAARMIVDDTIDEQGFGGLKTSRQQYDEREEKRKKRAAAKEKEEEEAKKKAEAEAKKKADAALEIGEPEPDPVDKVAASISQIAQKKKSGKTVDKKPVDKKPGEGSVGPFAGGSWVDRRKGTPKAGLKPGDTVTPHYDVALDPKPGSPLGTKKYAEPRYPHDTTKKTPGALAAPKPKETDWEPHPDPKDKPAAPATVKKKDRYIPASSPTVDIGGLKPPKQAAVKLDPKIGVEEPPRKKAEKPKDERDAFTRWAEKKLGLNRSAKQIKKDLKVGTTDPAYGKDFAGSQAHMSNSYQHELEVQEAIRDAVNRINEADDPPPGVTKKQWQNPAVRKEIEAKGYMPGRKPAGSQTGSGTSTFGAGAPGTKTGAEREGDLSSIKQAAKSRRQRPGAKAETKPSVGEPVERQGAARRQVGEPVERQGAAPKKVGEPVERQGAARRQVGEPVERQGAARRKVGEPVERQGAAKPPTGIRPPSQLEKEKPRTGIRPPSQLEKEKPMSKKQAATAYGGGPEIKPKTKPSMSKKQAATAYGGGPEIGLKKKTDAVKYGGGPQIGLKKKTDAVKYGGGPQIKPKTKPSAYTQDAPPKKPTKPSAYTQDAPPPKAKVMSKKQAAVAYGGGPQIGLKKKQDAVKYGGGPQIGLKKKTDAVAYGGGQDRKAAKPAVRPAARPAARPAVRPAVRPSPGAMGGPSKQIPKGISKVKIAPAAKKVSRRIANVKGTQASSMAAGTQAHMSNSYQPEDGDYMQEWHAANGNKRRVHHPKGAEKGDLRHNKKNMSEVTGDKEEYTKFFNSAMKKFGVTSPDQLKGGKQKEFYDYVDANWKGDNEKAEQVVRDFKVSSMREALRQMWSQQNEEGRSPGGRTEPAYSGYLEPGKTRKAPKKTATNKKPVVVNLKPETDNNPHSY